MIKTGLTNSSTDINIPNENFSILIVVFRLKQNFISTLRAQPPRVNIYMRFIYEIFDLKCAAIVSYIAYKHVYVFDGLLSVVPPNT